MLARCGFFSSSSSQISLSGPLLGMDTVVVDKLRLIQLFEEDTTTVTADDCDAINPHALLGYHSLDAQQFLCDF